MLEKPNAQNRAACKNQSKQHKFEDHWKSVKTVFEKKTMGDDTKETERLTKTQGLTKDFTSYKIRCKYLRKKVLQLVKAINYWEMATKYNEINSIKFVELNKFGWMCSNLQIRTINL